jgi:hypothetical protein
MIVYCVKYCVPCAKDYMTCLCCKFNYTYAFRNGLHLGMLLYLKFAMQTSRVILNVKCLILGNHIASPFLDAHHSEMRPF